MGDDELSDSYYEVYLSDRINEESNEDLLINEDIDEAELRIEVATYLRLKRKFEVEWKL